MSYHDLDKWPFPNQNPNIWPNPSPNILPKPYVPPWPSTSPTVFVTLEQFLELQKELTEVKERLAIIENNKPAEDETDAKKFEILKQIADLLDIDLEIKS